MISRDEYINLIKKEYPNDWLEIIDGLSKKRSNALRVNTIKISVDEALKNLDDLGIKYYKSDISDFSYLVDSNNKDLMDLDMFKNGEIYLQSISSQLPPLFLDINESHDILDMCAAPGGKTSEIQMIGENQKSIMALEADKIRCERLKYNLEHLGCKNINVMKKDARTIDSFFRFDTILLDAPCSGSGTINLEAEKDLKAFSVKLVENSSKLQKALLKKALEVLKPGHTMVYSTCSILKMENEDVLKSVLNKNLELMPLDINIETLPASLQNTYTIKPSDKYEGFFIAKIKKIR
ncbi:MAG: RsmB/NOP family class I SAM-dependent RNA methyltransferase [Acholeplasmatales bacterium]|nr:RsmB/NOP family class I SAM-dependent RNA methyltransferase [Acholeplasmatales bacterium]